MATISVSPVIGILLAILLFSNVEALTCYSCNGCSSGVMGDAVACNGTYSMGPMCYRQTVKGVTTQDYAGCIDLCVIGPSGISAITWTKCCTTNLCNDAAATLSRLQQTLPIQMIATSVACALLSLRL